MLVLTALTVLALAAPGEPFGGKLPYPRPRLIQVSENTKCDMGTVLMVDASHAMMRGTTPAGVVTYKVGPDVQVFSKEGRPVGGISALATGLRYRAYYLVDDGAKVLEIDLD